MQRVISPRNENFNVLVQIKFLNIFLYISKKKLKKIYWSKKSFTGLGLEDWCSLWGLGNDFTFRNMTFIETVVPYYKATPSAMKKWPYKMASFHGDNSVVFYCLSTSEIQSLVCLDGQFSRILLSQCIWDPVFGMLGWTIQSYFTVSVHTRSSLSCAWLDNSLAFYCLSASEIQSLVCLAGQFSSILLSQCIRDPVFGMLGWTIQ